MTRFIRFLPTARLSVFRDTAIPRREIRRLFLRARTLKHESEDAVGFLKTCLNSEGFLSFCSLLNDLRVVGSPRWVRGAGTVIR